MKITDLLKKESIITRTQVASREEAIDLLISLHEKAGNLNDREAYKESILAREASGTTAIGDGIATALANGILGLCGTNAIVALVCICLVGTFLTEFISNTAAAAIFYPIAYQTAMTLGVNPVTFCVALMIAVSSSFATPIGSPTHMMVYGEGGYRFSDFMRIGLVMNLIILAANIFIVTLLFPLR